MIIGFVSKTSELLAPLSATDLFHVGRCPRDLSGIESIDGSSEHACG